MTISVASATAADQTTRRRLPGWVFRIVVVVVVAVVVYLLISTM